MDHIRRIRQEHLRDRDLLLRKVRGEARRQLLPDPPPGSNSHGPTEQYRRWLQSKGERMQIPNNTLSASQLRTYGAGGFEINEQENDKGCPRKYKAKYVDGLTEDGPAPYPLRYGSFFHQIMFFMEEEGLTPEEATEKAFEADMPQEMWTEAREDLENYLSRGSSPMDRFGTLAVEIELKALLYVDEDFGPVYFRGFLDSVGIDLEVPNVVHMIDFKTNRSPASVKDLLGDVQMRGYHWLLLQNWQKFLPVEPKIISHLDIIKYNDVEIAYTPHDIEDWHTWAITLARKILRDNDAEPVLNEGCGHCFVRDTCPAYNALPTIGEALQKEGAMLIDPVARLEWRDRANKVKNLLDKAVKEVDADFKEKAKKAGSIVVGKEMFVSSPNWINTIDLQKLHGLLGDSKFYEAVSTSKAAVERVTKGLPPSEKAQIETAIGRSLDGMTVKRVKS